MENPTICQGKGCKMRLSFLESDPSQADSAPPNFVYTDSVWALIFTFVQMACPDSSHGLRQKQSVMPRPTASKEGTSLICAPTPMWVTFTCHENWYSFRYPLFAKPCLTLFSLSPAEPGIF